MVPDDSGQMVRILPVTDYEAAVVRAVFRGHELGVPNHVRGNPLCKPARFIWFSRFETIERPVAMIEIRSYGRYNRAEGRPHGAPPRCYIGR